MRLTSSGRAKAAAHGQNVHYLHGALHLFDAGYQLQKYTWVNTGKALVDQANEALKKNLFPVFVAEGSSRSKLTKIQHSAYLHHNFKSFAGVIARRESTAWDSPVPSSVIHSCASNDAHVLEHDRLRGKGVAFVRQPATAIIQPVVLNYQTIWARVDQIGRIAPPGIILHAERRFL